jgi:hypothetical protein
MHYNTRYVHIVCERHDYEISRIFDVNCFANFISR